MAEGVGFEPTVPLRARLISSHAPANSDNRFEFETKEALRSFHHDRSHLRGVREAKNLTALKKLVAPELSMWAKPHAADVMPIDMLGDHAGYLLRSGAVQDSPEDLLMNIAKLEAEKAEKAAKR
jgi:hypothetical protein